MAGCNRFFLEARLFGVLRRFPDAGADECAGGGATRSPVPRRIRESDALPERRGKAAPLGAWRRGEASAARVGRKLGAQPMPNFAGSLPSGVRPSARSPLAYTCREWEGCQGWGPSL